MKYLQAVTLLTLFLGVHARADQKADNALMLAPKEAVQTSISGMLGKLAGKNVTLYLSNGKELTGTLSPEVNAKSSTLYVTSLEGKDYFGALIEAKHVVGISFYNKKN